MHTPIYVVDAPKIDESEDNQVAEFINEHITCALPDKTKYPEMNLVKKAESDHHATICKKKKGVACNFNVPWAPPDEARMFMIGEIKVKQCKKVIEKVLSYIAAISDLSDVTQSEILEKCGVTA